MRFILALLFTFNAFAQLPPTTIQGQAGAKQTTFNFQVPNRQATQTGGVNQLIETGNKNLLANPGFEHSTYSTGWTTSGTATYSAETSAPLAGLKSFKAVASAQTIDLLQDTTLYAAARAGSQMFFRFPASNTAAGVTACVRLNGVKQTSTNSCITLATDGVPRTYELAFLANGTSNGIEIDAASTTGTLIVDDVELSTDSSSFIDVAQIGPWISYTPTFQGFGTPTGVNVRYRINGSALEVEGQFVSGISTAAEAQMTLPTGFVTAPDYPTIQLVGKANYDGNATTDFSGRTVLTEASRSYVNFGREISAANGLAKSLGNAMISSGQGLHFFFRVRVQGLSNKVSTYSQACVRDVDCENNFSARSSSAGVVSQESLEWINGNCTYGTPTANAYNCPVNSGIFSVVPNCGAIVDGSRIMGYNPAASTTTNLVFGQQNPTTNGFTSDALFTFWCQKQGVDFKAKNVITGTFQDVVTSPGAGRPVLCSAKISSTGVISDQIGGCFASCTTSTSGAQTCTYTTSFWSGSPTCNTTSNNNAAGTITTRITAQSSSAFTVEKYSTTALNDAGGFNASCHGVRQ